MFDLLQLPDDAFTVKASSLICWWHIGAGNGALSPFPLKKFVGNKTESELAQSWGEVHWTGFLAKPATNKNIMAFQKHIWGCTKSNSFEVVIRDTLASKLTFASPFHSLDCGWNLQLTSGFPARGSQVVLCSSPWRGARRRLNKTPPEMGTSCLSVAGKSLTTELLEQCWP